MQDEGNANALTPIEIVIELRDGAGTPSGSMSSTAIRPSPSVGMTISPSFGATARRQRVPRGRDKTERLIERIDRLEDVADVVELVDLAAA